MSEFFTYMHRRNDTGAPFYIGKGVADRASAKGGRNPHWHNIVNAHGMSIEILAYWKSNKEAIEHEKFLIFCFRSMGIPLCNITAGGEGALGRRQTEAAKQRISKANTGRKCSEAHKAMTSLMWAGKPKPAAQRAKLAAAKRGTKKPAEEIAGYLPALRAAMARPEVKAKISAAAKRRRPVSLEARAQMAARQLGRTHSAETRAKMSIGIKAAIVARKLKQTEKKETT